MKSNRNRLALAVLLLVASMVLAMCAPAEPQTVVQTVVVEKTVEVEVEVEKTVEVEVEKLVEVEVEKLIEVQGAIPYPEPVPMGFGDTGSGVLTLPLDEIMAYKALDSYSQSPTIDGAVASGALPPVEERLPVEPQVLLASGMEDGLGVYGGVWRDFSACPTEGWAKGAGQTLGWFGIDNIYQESLLISGPVFRRSDAVEPMPNLAKSMEWSDDGYELTMHLIEGAKWSDGMPFSADDVMFTWEYEILDPNVNSSTSRTSWQIEGEDISLEKVDDYTIKWTFPVPFPVGKLFDMDDVNFHVDPKHIWEPLHPAFSDNDYVAFEKAWPADKLPAVSMGPWIPVEYKTDELLVFRRNPYYWKVDESGQQLPYLDEVVFEKGSTGVGRTLSTLAGSGDHSNLENPGAFIETLKRSVEPDAHFYVEWGPETLAFSLHINQSASLGVENERDTALRELFRNVDFRRAVSMAIDRDGVAQAVVRGPFLRAWPGGLYPGASEFSRESVVYYPYAPEGSKTLLADLGLEDTDGNGILNWTSGPLEGDDLVIALTANEDQQAGVDVAQALVPLMGEIGIQLNFRPLKPTIAGDNTENGTWEWHVSRGGQAYAVPFTRARELAPITKESPSWHREGEEPRDLQPYEKELIDIVNEFSLEPDSAKRAELMAAYNRIFTENVYDIGIVVGRYGLMLAERFKNIPQGSPTFLYQWTWANVMADQVWVDPAEQIDQIRPGVIPSYGE
jgi:peptide/nickel transport system substrate-binding protein